MPHDAQLIFADHVGRFYARQYAFPPMAGRLLGYLFVCDPPQQTIDELGQALLASRSAITGAVTLLESSHMVRRTRLVGERVDHVSLDPGSQQPQNFDATLHLEHAALFREGLGVLADAPPDRRAPLEEMVALAEFLSRRLPALRAEWVAHRDELRASGALRRPRPRSASARAPPDRRGDHSGRSLDQSTEGQDVMTDSYWLDLRARAAGGDAHAIDELVANGDLEDLRRLAAAGSRDAVDQLVENGDLEDLRRLAAAGSRDAVDQLVELAGERGDAGELRRLAASGSSDAADVLAELVDE